MCLHAGVTEMGCRRPEHKGLSSAIQLRLFDSCWSISALLQELRGKLTANGAQHVETLQRVQGICMEAERRAEAADR